MKKILIADDEARIRRLVCDFLKNAGFETVEAADGNEAIEKFLECGDIDLVICDIMMPGADGWEVCKRIRESADVPILMLTARSQEFDELMSFESGADDFVTKPFSPVVLVKRVQALLKRSEGKKAESGDIIRLDGLTIDLPAHTGIELRSERIGTNLPGQIDLQRRIDRRNLRVFGNYEGIVRNCQKP